MVRATEVRDEPADAGDQITYAFDIAHNEGEQSKRRPGSEMRSCRYRQPVRLIQRQKSSAKKENGPLGG
jgi:hypothetical protein